MNIGVEQFGKDHWSLLVYVGTRCSDYKGVLDKEHLRIKNDALRGSDRGFGSCGWKPEWGTRLFGYFGKNGEVLPKLLLTDHDDYGCLDDLEHAGFVESTGTGFNPAYKVTKKGSKVISLIALYKQEGQHYANFKYKEEQKDD